MAGMQRQTTGNGTANGRGVEGRPQSQALAQSTPEAQLKHVLFVERRRELEALFPSDGKELVNRLASMAVAGLRRLQEIATLPISIPSLVDAVTHAAQLGLDIVGDQAYLVPYNDHKARVATVQFITGPGGLITLAYRQQIVASARCVFDGDDFGYDFGTDYLHHVKATEGRRPPDPRNKKAYQEALEECIVFAYARFKRVGAARDEPPMHIEVLTQDDIAFYRSFSKASSGPWFDNYEAMCRKTVLKRGFSYVPKGYILTTALQEDEHGAFVPPPRLSELDETRTLVQVPADVAGDDAPGASAGTPPSNRGAAAPVDEALRGVDPNTHSFVFGREPGVPIVKIKDLEYYQGALKRSIGDPAKAKFRADNEAALVTIEAELRRRSGEVDEEPPIRQPGGDG